MPTCRSIPPSVWEHARQALVFYFSRRHGLDRAEDLAQETLTVLWSRDDYEFDEEKHFLRVCHGFAHRVMLAQCRKHARYSTASVDAELVPAPDRSGFGLDSIELGIYLDEVIRSGKSALRPQDWQLILNCVDSASPGSEESNRNTLNRLRVQLHRARRRLADLTGFRKGTAG